MSEMAEMVF